MAGDIADKADFRAVKVIVNTTIGNNLRALRGARGMSQSDVADELAVTFQQIHKYETGKSALSVPHLLHLCASLGWTIEDFLAGLPDDLRPQNCTESPLRVALMSSQFHLAIIDQLSILDPQHAGAVLVILGALNQRPGVASESAHREDNVTLPPSSRVRRQRRATGQSLGAR